MKKELLITTSVFLLIATPALAKSDNGNNGQGEEHKSEKAQEVLATHDNNGHKDDDHTVSQNITSPVVQAAAVDDPSITPSVTVTISPVVTQTQTCDPNAEWKNHGQYVSCVAHTHQGGQMTSEAARSDVGKKHHGESPTPSVSPSVSPSASPTATLTPTDTPPITSAANELSFNSFLDIQGLFKKLAKLLSHFRV